MGIPSISLRETISENNLSLNDLTLVLGVCITGQSSNQGPIIVRNRSELSKLAGFSLSNSEWKQAYYLADEASLVVVTSNSASLTSQVANLYAFDGCDIEAYTDLGNRLTAAALLSAAGTDGWIRDGEVQIKPPSILIIHYDSGLPAISDTISSQVAIYEGSVNILISDELTKIPLSTAYCKCLIDSNLKGNLYKPIRSLSSPIPNVTSTDEPFTRSDRISKYNSHKSNCAYLNYHHGQYLIDSDRTYAASGLVRESWRRLANKINRDIFYMSEVFIGRQANSLLLEEITSLVSSYLSEYLSKMLISDYKVYCDTDNNSETDLANGRINLQTEIQLDPICDTVNINTTYNLNYE